MAAAAAVAIGGGLAQSSLVWIGLLVATVALIARQWAIAFFLVCGLVVGLAAASRQGEPPPAPASLSVDFLVVAVTDPAPSERGWVFVGRLVEGGGKVAVVVAERTDLMAGDTAEATGTLRFNPGRLHRHDVSGWLAARRVLVVHRADGLLGIANAIRTRVHKLFPDGESPSALMRGFLIGDTSAIAPVAIDEMKRAGLVHFVAVSGGNVALFLGAVWLALGLVPLGPRTRAACGVFAVFVFVLVTRWEPSVVRAGLMIGLVLGGRVLGVPLSGWSALGLALTAALLVSPELLFDVGFQLSVLATAGLLFGSRLWDGRRPRPMWRAMAATFSAQLAVSPLLIASFGSVPAFSTMTNVLAAPVVTAATAVGWGATLLNIPAAATAAAGLADWVLELSRLAAALPQVGPVGVAALIGGAVVLSVRPALGALGVAAMLVIAVLPAPYPPGPVAVFLDVGQGDAAIVRSGSGAVIAVDTGPDPTVYAAALRRHRVSHIDLLVLTHSDQDHVGGLEALPQRVTVGRVWVPAFTEIELWERLLSGLDTANEAVTAGVAAEVDGIRLSVLSPGRRFAADNDGSVVLWIESGAVTALLGGDVETVAQRELPPVRPDLLLVPHHGSSTTDVDWLLKTVGPVAVLSYGRSNQFGHPAPDIVVALESSNTTVFDTSEGDVVVPLTGSYQPASSRAVAQRRPNIQAVSRFV